MFLHQDEGEPPREGGEASGGEVEGSCEYCRTFHRARRLFLAFPLDFFEKIRKRYRVTLQIDNEIGDNDSPLTSLNSGWVEGK